MAINVVEVKAKAAQHACALPVVQDGWDLTVSAGAFVIDSKNYELPEEQEFTSSANAEHVTDVTGYLVRDKGTDGVILLVDEVCRDGFDTPYDFSSSSSYELLHRLFHVSVRAAATDIASEVVSVFHIVE